MSSNPATSGTVASLHLHADHSGGHMRTVSELNLIVDRGIREDTRYFGRRSRTTGRPSRRQISLINRETIAEHAATLGLESLAPGMVRANIETFGIDLISWLGREVLIGSALVHFYEPRTPCKQMDAICSGLRQLMENNRQGVMAEIVRSGVVRIGDSLRLP